MNSIHGKATDHPSSKPTDDNQSPEKLQLIHKLERGKDPHLPYMEELFTTQDFSLSYRIETCIHKSTDVTKLYSGEKQKGESWWLRKNLHDLSDDEYYSPKVKSSVHLMSLVKLCFIHACLTFCYDSFYATRPCCRHVYG